MQSGMETREHPQFGALLRRLRTAAALSQEELAERAGLSVRGLSDLERSVHRTPRPETVRLLADALALAESERAELCAAARPEPMEPMAAGPIGLSPFDPLPSAPTRLIGREAEMAVLTDLLATHDGRLVTLTGAGGTGKTRLAQAAAAKMRDHYRGGVCLVDLSPLTDPALVLPAIATALGVREIASESLLETLSRSLRERRLLLLIDNCEQVLGAAADVAALLAACPDVVILATSRVPLRVRAEREVAVAPLSLPDPGRLPPLTELESVAAVALFVERARAVSAEFALTADNAEAVAAICQRLDGLPLAIELAAARVRVLPPAGLLTRLERRLSLLTGGGRDLPARQRTMRDAIAWSYALLSPQEQALYRCLSVFVGGFTLLAAEAVAPPEGDLPIFEGIAALIEQSLVRQAPGSEREPRYVLLELVREFGLEMLATAVEMAASRERHARYYLGPDDVATQYFPILGAAESSSLLAAERDNVRLALTWLDERGEMEALLSRTMLLYRLWFAPGLYREGQHWIERALAQTNDAAPRVRFRALDAAISLAQFRGDHDHTAAYIADSLALAHELGDPLLIGEALTSAGLLAYRQGEYGRAEALLLEAHGLHRGRTDRSPDGVALSVLGDIALVQEQFDRAAAWYEETIEITQTNDFQWVLSDAQAGLGGVRFCLGNTGRAAALFGDSLARAQDWGFTVLVVSPLFGLAAIAAASGQPETGARLLGAAEGIAASLGAPTYPRDTPVRERALATLTETLGEERLLALREVGRALAVAEAVAEAKAVVYAVVLSAP
jgi:predicted ATPase/transcriptional regulator with XRE-family HTH domain